MRCLNINSTSQDTNDASFESNLETMIYLNENNVHFNTMF